MLNLPKVIAVIIIVIAAALSHVATYAATSYSTLAMKAERFYSQREWASAAAMFALMLDERPRDYSLYARAIVATAMIPDSVGEMQLIDKAFTELCPVDSLFNGVKRATFAIGQTALCERLLEKVKRSYPWTQRIVDAQLLDYYVFRHAARKMLEYSDIMLSGSTDSTKFLRAKAQALLLLGRNREAEIELNRIIELDPGDIETLVTLGFLYLAEDQKSGSQEQQEHAASLLGRAYKLHPTPYLDRLLHRLHGGN